MSTTSKAPALFKLLAIISLGVVVFLTTPNDLSPPEPSESSTLTKDDQKASTTQPNTATPSPGSAVEATGNQSNETSTTPPAPAPQVNTPISPVTPRADYQPPSSKFKNAQNPIARKALAGVGADPQSERVWLEAINDPNLPANERQDLIEDLNEDGISNPAQPTDRDLALIKSRISLIEHLLPTAMDQTNAAAFKEAQKDLLNMLKRLER